MENEKKKLWVSLSTCYYYKNTFFSSVRSSTVNVSESQDLAFFPLFPSLFLRIHSQMLLLSDCLFSHYVNVFPTQKMNGIFGLWNRNEKVCASAKKMSRKEGGKRKQSRKLVLNYTRIHTACTPLKRCPATVIMETHKHIYRAFTAFTHTQRERKSYKTIQAELFCEKSNLNVA